MSEFPDHREETLYKRSVQIIEAAKEHVEAAEVADIVLETAGRRNGWKVILGRCAPERMRGSRARARRTEG